jgi:dihydrofolate synthase/folylpolyglutamate synthase
MDHAAALAFLDGRVNYEQRSPRPSDLKLDRMHALLRLLDDPHRRLRVVHVAGSKGKGSTSAMLAEVLRRGGYRVGLFTSPHLCRIEERIQIDGQPIMAEEFAALVTDLAPAVAVLDHRYPEQGSRLTFFEVVTALGFLAFVRRRVDVAVLEVGLGGRFDSTNVVRKPLACLITSISFDHVQQLGNTLARIAREKAGIVKPGAVTVSGATAPEAREVIADVCRQRRSPLLELGRDFRYRYEPGLVTNLTTIAPRVEVATARGTWPTMELGLLGEHQAENAAVVVATVERLRDQGLRLDDEAVAAGLAQVTWPARLEVVGRSPLVVLDCAHNVASARAVVETLRMSFPLAPGGRRLLIFAGSGDKDLGGMFAVLAPYFDQVLLTRYVNNPRGVAPEPLAEMLQRVSDSRPVLCATSAEAWQLARTAAGLEDLIVATGSVFLAGELRPLLMGEQQGAGKCP